MPTMIPPAGARGAMHAGQKAGPRGILVNELAAQALEAEGWTRTPQLEAEAPISTRPQPLIQFEEPDDLAELEADFDTNTTAPDGEEG